MNHIMNNKHIKQSGHGRDRSSIKSTAPWAWVSFTKKDGTVVKARRRVYLNCYAGEMMIDRHGHRRFFTGPHKDSRLSYELI